MRIEIPSCYHAAIIGGIICLNGDPDPGEPVYVPVSKDIMCQGISNAGDKGFDLRHRDLVCAVSPACPQALSTIRIGFEHLFCYHYHLSSQIFSLVSLRYMIA